MTSGLPGLGGTTRFVEPAVVATHFFLRAGDKLADFGAGAGYFTPILSKLVGEEGKVYACEIQKNLVERIGNLAREQHLSNVVPVWCDLESLGGTKLADGCLDAGLLVNTLFQVVDKAVALKEIMRTLRSGGKLFVIDWSESFSGLGPAPQEVLTVEEARSACEAGGFVFERDFPAGAHHYGLAFRKP